MIGVGGYASGPAMLMGGILRVPAIAFEPNVVPGFANRLAARTAKAAAVQFEKTCAYFRNCQVTGVPVRREFFNVPPRPKDAQPTLLVFGGSQGAHAINPAVLEALPRLAEAVPGLRIIHQTGEKDYVDAQAEYLKHMVAGRGLALHRRHAGRVRARRSGALPLGSQHRRRNHRCRQAGHLRSLANGGRRPSTPQRRGAGQRQRRTIAAASRALGGAAGHGNLVAVARSPAPGKHGGCGARLCPSRRSR